MYTASADAVKTSEYGNSCSGCAWCFLQTLIRNAPPVLKDFTHSKLHRALDFPPPLSPLEKPREVVVVEEERCVRDGSRGLRQRRLIPG